MFDIFKKSEEDIKQEKTDKMERFFGINLGVKKELHSLVPTETDLYSNDSIVKYMDKLYDGLRDFKFDFKAMGKSLDLDKDTIKRIDEFITSIMNECAGVRYEPNEIRRFFSTRVSGMREEFVQEVKRHFVGYTGFNSIESFPGNIVSINELLHLYHSYTMNNNELLQSLNVIDSRSDGYYGITLYGKSHSETKSIFDSFPKDTGAGDVDLIGLPAVNKSLMMVRDKGHALSIEVTYEDKDAVVEYFIPKLCNIDMINALPGVVKVKEETPMHNGTTGMFVTTKDILPYELSDFVRMVPEDKDIPMVHYDGPVRRV